MSFLRLLLLIFLVNLPRGTVMQSWAQEDLPAALLKVESSALEAWVQPARGGRTVILREPGGANLLDAEPSTWSRPELSFDELKKAHWEQDRGQVVWWGPQDRFWSDQTLHEKNHTRKANWPPDPFLTEAAYQVIEHSPGRLVLRSPASPFSHIQLTKVWEALPDGGMRFRAQAQALDMPIQQRNLWFNLRLHPRAIPLVPVAHAEDVRLEPADGGRSVLTSYPAGLWTLEIPENKKNADKVAVKAFIQPEKGWMAGAFENGFLVQIFPPTPAEKMVENHAPVEIFVEWLQGRCHLLEMEQHGPKLFLSPGETAWHEEIWRWIPLENAQEKGRWQSLREIME